MSSAPAVPSPDKPGSTTGLPAPDPEKRRIAAENFDRARQVTQTGNHDYAVSLLKICCKLDPANDLYRVHLRKAQKAKFGPKMKGSSFSFFSTSKYKARIKSAKGKRDWLAVLENGDEVLTRDPWDIATSMDMAEAFDALGLLKLAIFTLDQCREKFKNNSTLNRQLARYFEKAGEYKAATALWQLVLQANKNDVEAQAKAKDLLANETTARLEASSVHKQQSGVMAAPGAAGSKGHAALPAGSAGHAALGSGEAPSEKLTRDEAPLRKRLEADPTEPSLYVQLSNLYRRHGANDRARAVLQQGLGPTGNHYALQIELLELDLLPVRKALAETEAKLARKKAKKGTDDDLVDEGPSEEELTKQRAKLARELLTREAEILKTKADKFPAEVVHRLELGARLLKLDQVDDAIAALQPAKRDERGKGKAALLLGVAFLKKKNSWALAKRNLEEAVQSLAATEEASKKEALYHLATGSAANGDLALAIEVGHELANLDFGYKNISKLLDDWHLKSGK